MHRILIVDDDTGARKALRRLLQRQDYEISEASTVTEAETGFRLGDFDLIISDLRPPGEPGTKLIGKAGNVPVLLMTGYASLRSAVESMRLGAVDYIAKPFDGNDMVAAVRRAIEGQDRGAKASHTPAPIGEAFIGSCPQMVSQFDKLKKAAPTDVTVLVLGETGTGKELVARNIHQHSTRRDKPMIAVNCAAIPESLLESELFGYEKGAFTGANTSHTGLVEAADGGTLFLDEIGELPFEAQARLLRFVQEGEIRRVGSVDSRRVDVRLICATHRNLRQLTAEGKFRHDLYYRIDVMRLQLPPLRERGKDVLELAEFLLAERGKHLGKPARRFTPKAVQAITTYAWPGNVRELENAVERAVIMADGEDIDKELLGIDVNLAQVSQLHPAQPRVANFDPPENLSLEDYFQRFVLEHQDAMSETELAQKLGISRKCLWERRQRFDIPRKKAGGGKPRKATNVKKVAKKASK